MTSCICTVIEVDTEFSLLDGANRSSELAPYIKGLGMNSVACTEHGWMAGVVDFYKTCKKHNIKSLIGVEAYISDDEDGLENEHKTRDNMHCVLIAKNNQGYKDLLEAVSNAAINNFYYRPRISKENLRKLSGNVICTSACLGGILSKKLEFKLDHLGRATHCEDSRGIIHKEIEFFASVFNNDFYLEIQDWDSGDRYQPIYNKYILDIGKEVALPFVITSDAHYLKKEDEQLHKMLMAMQLKKTLKDYEDQGKMQYGPHFYIKSPEEMLQGACNWNCEESYYNTGKIADQCNVEIELGHYSFPKFDIEEADDYSEFLDWKKSRTSNVIECSHC